MEALAENMAPFAEAMVCSAPAGDEWPVARGSEFMRSQHGQDAFLAEHHFGGVRNGVYLDLGCNDGVSNSNTYYFNKALSWRGRCFEASPGSKGPRRRVRLLLELFYGIGTIRFNLNTFSQ